MNRIRLSLRRPVVIATLFFMVLGLVLCFFPRPLGLGVGDIKADASASTGTDYVNMYQPAMSRLLQDLVGRRVRISRIGGRQEVLFDGTLSSGDASNLREFFVTTTPYDATVKGSPLAVEALNSVRWLAKQSQAPRYFIFLTDGMEQVDAASVKAAAKSGAGVTAIILFPRAENPRIAELLRVAGARVVVARTMDDAHRVLTEAITGITPAVALRQRLAQMLVALAMLCLVFLGVRVQLEPAPEPIVEVKDEETPVLPPPPPALRMRLQVRATINREVLEPVSRVLSCVEAAPAAHPQARGVADAIPVRSAGAAVNGDRSVFTIGYQGMPGVDLALPLAALGRNCDVRLRLAVTRSQDVMVHNDGEVPLGVGGRFLRQGATGRTDANSSIMVGPDVRLGLSLEPVAEVR